MFQSLIGRTRSTFFRLAHRWQPVKPRLKISKSKGRYRSSDLYQTFEEKIESRLINPLMRIVVYQGVNC